MTDPPKFASARRGALIVIEGLDRAGKSSQCEILRKYLEKQEIAVKYIRFPGDTIQRLKVECPYSDFV